MKTESKRNADPLRAWKRRERGTIALALAGVAAAAWWAIDGGDRAQALPSVAPRAASAKNLEDGPPPLDLTGFRRARLTRESTSAQDSTKQDAATSSRFGALALVAIVEDAVGFRAALFGETSNELVLAKGGDSVRDVRVLRVERDYVEVEQGAERKKLVLKDGPRSLRGGP